MDKKVLRWNFIFQYGYVITNIINSLILLPFYLKEIDAATLGVWLATGNILAWMTLIDPGIGEVLQQKIAELRGKNLNEEVGKTIGSGLIASSFILLLSVIAGFIFYSLIGIIINKDVTHFPNLQNALFISIISTGMSLTSFSLSGINQGFHNASQVAISSILANILFLIVNIILLMCGYGIISIAAANLSRAFFINIYNFTALKSILKRENMEIIFNRSHFKRFIKIFSFTSTASIIGGFTASMDTIVLARFIPPAMITIFEINKRPIQLSQSLIGRHSVALMPSISHAVGKGDKNGVSYLITKHFKYYMYTASFFAMIFCFNYSDLINAWTGRGKFIGNTVIYLLIANFFFGLLGYFMNNMGYAVGDIKVNSMISIIKGLVMGGLYYMSAKLFGIPGLLIAMLSGTLLIDVTMYSFRLYKMKYINLIFAKKIFRLLTLTILLSSIVGLILNYIVNNTVNADLHIVKLLFKSFFSLVFFVAIVLTNDSNIRTELYDSLNIYFGSFKETLRKYIILFGRK